MESVKQSRTSAATKASLESRAKTKASKDMGHRKDKLLLPEIDGLNSHARTTYTGTDLERILVFIDMAKEFWRGVNYRKKSIQTLDCWQPDDELDLKFEDRKFIGIFVDGWIHSMVELARSVHLTPELTEFWVKTLEKSQEWFKQNPENLEAPWLEEIAAELEARKRGEDTYRDPNRRPVGRPPKPKTEVSPAVPDDTEWLQVTPEIRRYHRIVELQRKMTTGLSPAEWKELDQLRNPVEPAVV
jgi:hypothetical protein